MNLRGLTQALLNVGIRVVVPEILDELPHDPVAFTQGLAFADSRLYEGTGLERGSSIRRIDPATGDVERIRELPGHFGEGIAVRGEQIVQLTWHSGVAFVYRLADFSRIDEWPVRGEGWGLAATGEGFVMTNGSSELRFLDPGFRPVRTAGVRRKGLALGWLNDLEIARGSLFVHRLGDRYLFEIDPDRGRVLRLIDGVELIRRAHPRGEADVFNGIAYDPEQDIFYLTGKRWPLLFKVRIPFD